MTWVGHLWYHHLASAPSLGSLPTMFLFIQMLYPTGFFVCLFFCFFFFLLGTRQVHLSFKALFFPVPILLSYNRRVNRTASGLTHQLKITLMTSESTFDPQVLYICIWAEPLTRLQGSKCMVGTSGGEKSGEKAEGGLRSESWWGKTLGHPLFIPL